MKELIEKLVLIETNLSESIGDFNLFALFEREDIQGKYDIIISIELGNFTKNELFKIIHENFTQKLKDDELLMFSRYVYLFPTDPFVQNINSLITVTHSNTEIKNTNVNGLQIKHAIIFTSIRENKISNKELS